MKTIFRFFLLLLLLQTSPDASKAQAPRRVRDIGGTEYLLPQIDWLIRFVEQDDAAWETEMENLGFTYRGRDARHTPIYMQGEIGDRVLVVSREEGSFIHYVWTDFVSGESLAGEFRDFLQPYFTEREEDMDFYRYKTWLLGMRVTEMDDFREETLFIQKTFF